jgi:hypothetical protein
MSPPCRAALVIAHPGHELRVHRWLELARPVVYVLTDGSGHTGRSRLASTSELLARAGARPGPIYGRLADHELYGALLKGDRELFAGLAEELAESLRREEIELVAGDAVEGFNPSHDVCRLLLNAAVAGLRARGLPIDNRDFLLDGRPDGFSEEERAESLRIELDGPSLARKLAAARSYPGLAEELESALARHGEGAFRTEWLRPVRYGLEIGDRCADPPFYELHGERQVAAGFYREVLRYRSHVVPVAERLRRLHPTASPNR